MENTKKRQYRELSDETKDKIIQSMRNKSKTSTHKENISNGLKNYWTTVPNKPTNEKAESDPYLTTCQGDKTCNTASKIKKLNFRNSDKI